MVMAAFRWRWIALGSLLVTLVGCGFQLRGGNISELPPLRILGGQSGNGIRLELDQLMPTEAKDGSDKRPTQGVLRILQEKYDRRPLSISTLLTVQEYQLLYSVSFQLTDPNGQPLAPPQTLNFSRDYSFGSAVQVLGKSNEEELLRREMMQDAARQLLAQILVLLRPK